MNNPEAILQKNGLRDSKEIPKAVMGLYACVTEGLAHHRHISFQQQFLSVHQFNFCPPHKYPRVHKLSLEITLPTYLWIIRKEVLVYKQLFAPTIIDLKTQNLVHRTLPGEERERTVV